MHPYHFHSTLLKPLKSPMGFLKSQTSPEKRWMLSDHKYWSTWSWETLSLKWCTPGVPNIELGDSWARISPENHVCVGVFLWRARYYMLSFKDFIRLRFTTSTNISVLTWTSESGDYIMIDACQLGVPHPIRVPQEASQARRRSRVDVCPWTC